ncbi:glycosyltransferase family 2 protein [Flavobacterium antarcticum]|uniref:glycosyltransferase n=1 Tax=Flavobacterium antarcticum TaxID=271155 RepID=UPI0003B3C824|nr:glycosyltransferase [Flavobacterium antarcticum]
MFFSLIIPVYNRPDEIDELLSSLLLMDFDKDFEVVIIEDGSSLSCEAVVRSFNSKLNISYYFKENSGPGDSRNFGMKKAKGDYFIIFDSDCIIPPNYLLEVEKALLLNYVDCFGGPDKALDSFSDVQKAINFAMTSFITTGGIRGGSEQITKFQPRSFNMGLSKKAFEASGGFGKIHPGEDPDLSIRLWNLGFETKLFPEAYVYHKRRIDWSKFYKQVNKFGKARPILNHWYPKYSKITFYFPTIFLIGILIAIATAFFKNYILLLIFSTYIELLFIVALLQTRSFKIGLLAVLATLIQFYGYGIGFLKSMILVQVFKKKPQKAFPELFF